MNRFQGGFNSTVSFNNTNLFKRDVAAEAYGIDVKPLLLYEASKGVIFSGSFVTNWLDQSGNNFHLSQSTAGRYPQFSSSLLNSRPALLFSASITSSLHVSSVPLSTFTTFFVVKTRGGVFYEHGPNPNTSLGSTFSPNKAPSVASGIVRALPALNFATTTLKTWTTTTVSDNTWRIVTQNHGATHSDHKIELNGIASADQSDVSLTGVIISASLGTTSTTQGFNVGGRYNTITNRANMEVAEILVFSPNLTSDQRLIVTNILKAKYGI